jgi:hypothetical protein
VCHDLAADGVVYAEIRFSLEIFTGNIITRYVALTTSSRPR